MDAIWMLRGGFQGVGRTSREAEFSAEDAAGAWFDFEGVDGLDHLGEQSFLLLNDEALTVLRLPDEAVA
jgi:hypothetical protein